MKKTIKRVVSGFWERFLRGVSTKRKTAVIFVLFACIPMLVTILVYYRHSMSIVENEVSQSILKALAQTEDNLNFRMNMVAETASGVMASIYPYVDREPGTDTLAQQIDDFGSISNLVSAYGGKNMIRKFRVFVDEDKLYAHQHDTFFPLSELGDAAGLRRSFDAGKNVLWQGTYRLESTLHGDDDVFSCVCMAKKLDSSDEFALVLCADVRERDVAALLDLGMNYGESVSLVSGDGKLLSGGKGDALGEELLSPEELDAVRGQKMGLLSGNREYIVAFDRMDFTGWYLVARVPRERIYGAAKGSFNLTSILTVSAVFLILALSTLLFYSFVMDSAVRRINLMTVELRREGTKALGSRGKSDLSALEENVDSMAGTIRELMEDSYRDRLVSREAQLRALQAQINPHFLYNTLDTIKWMILDGENSESVRMVNALSNYFRLSLSKGRDVVTIQSECDLCRTYLDIQRVRLDGNFLDEMDVQPDVLSCMIPKLTLQPLVENALLHGLAEREGEGPGKISVSISGGEDIRISVRDNGCGMTPEQVEGLLEKRSGSSGYGLHNVEERVRLFSGDGYGLSVRSEPGRGTEVTVRLRCVRQDDPIIQEQKS